MPSTSAKAASAHRSGTANTGRTIEPPQVTAAAQIANNQLNTAGAGARNRTSTASSAGKKMPSTARVRRR